MHQLFNVITIVVVPVFTVTDLAVASYVPPCILVTLTVLKIGNCTYIGPPGNVPQSATVTTLGEPETLMVTPYVERAQVASIKLTRQAIDGNRLTRCDPNIRDAAPDIQRARERE